MKNFSATVLTIAVLAPSSLFGAATEADLQALTSAMELCQLDTARYTTIENLDDTSFMNSTNPFQFINDGGGALVIVPGKGDVEPVRRDLVNGALPWQGPYVNVPPQRLDGADSEYDEGTILDFWGNPYYFYTPLGLVDPIAEAITLRDYGDAFDRYTFVSFGPDGVMSGDDVIWPFGSGLTVPTISAAEFVPTTVRGGETWTLEVRGYNLGASQGSGDILFDGMPDGSVTITSWSGNRIEAQTSSMPTEGVIVSVETSGGSTTRSVALMNGSSASAIPSWTLY